MKTVANCVEEILVSQPFLEDALTRNILNYSALADELRETISKMLRKPVKSGAIMMALRRYSPPPEMANKIKLNKALQNLGDITTRSHTKTTFLPSPLPFQRKTQKLRDCITSFLKDLLGKESHCTRLFPLPTNLQFLWKMNMWIALLALWKVLRTKK